MEHHPSHLCGHPEAGVVRRMSSSGANATSSSTATAKAAKKSCNLHGTSYHILLALVILLRAFRMQKNQKNVTFIVTTEDDTGGKFDDIVCRRKVSGTTSDTVYIQVKHKQTSTTSDAANAGTDSREQPRRTIKELDLVTANEKSKRNPFDISKYFRSFIESYSQHAQREGNHMYLLCTNAIIDQCLEQHFIKLSSLDDHFSFAKDTDAVCYKINRSNLLPNLNTKLKHVKDASDEMITKFFERFYIVCNTISEKALPARLSKLLPTWASKDKETTIEKMQVAMFNAMKNERVEELGINDLKDIFVDINPNENTAYLRTSTKNYLETASRTYPYIKICPTIIANSPLYQFIQNKSSSGVYHYRTPFDWQTSALAVEQTLKQVSRECLFVEIAAYPSWEEVLNVLRDVMSYINDVDHPTLDIITIIGNLTFSGAFEDVQELRSEFLRKIIIVEQFSESADVNDQCPNNLLVGDLTAEAWNQLQQYDALKLFGTQISVKNIVHADDSLRHLQNILSFCEQENESITAHRHKYEKIRDWYIHRDFVECGDSIEEKQDMVYEDSLASAISKLKLKHVNGKATFQKLIYSGRPEFVGMLKQFSSAACCDSDETVPPGLCSDPREVSILINDAGFGKTVYFTWLASRLLDINPALYVISLKAMEYSTDFERLKDEPILSKTDTEIVRLLFRLVHLAIFVPSVNRQTTAETDAVRKVADHGAELLSVSNGQVVLKDDPASLQAHGVTTKQLIELRLFREKFNEKQMVLLLDGFDEVASYYKSPVLNCFMRFANFERLRKIYISSRPYDFEEDFRHTFPECRIYRLQPLSQHDQRVYLDNFLTRNVDDYKHCEPTHRHLVLCILYGIISNALDDVKTVPLLLNMAFHKMLPAVKQYINFQSETICSQIYEHDKFGTLQLVQAFVERKLEIVYIEKAGATDSATKVAAAKKNYEKLNKQAKQEHALLAVYFMFACEVRSKLLSRREKREAENLMQEVMNAQEQTGLIDGIRDGIPLFIHRIFAEYCVACWLHTNEDRLRKENFFRSRSFWAYGLKRTRDFLDQMIIREGEGEGSAIHIAVLNDSTEEVLRLLSHNPSLALATDADSRMPLHLAVTKLCNRADIRNALLSHMQVADINAKDALFQWSALDYAFVTDNESAIAKLLELGAEVNVEVFLNQLFANELDVVLRQGDRYCTLIKPWETGRSATGAIYAGVVNYLLNRKRLDIYSSQEMLGSLSVLQYCTKSKMYELFREFVQQSGEPTQVLADVAGHLLQVAFEVQAHHIINYLLDDCNFPLPWIKCSRNLIYALKAHIGLTHNRTFKIILKQFFVQRQYVGLNDEQIVDEYPDDASTGLSEDQYPKMCCVLDPQNVGLPLDEYDEYDYVNDATVFELLLTRAVHAANFHLTSYIVQKKQMTITNGLIVAILRLLPKRRGELHARSIPCFKYLLERTTDLHSKDNEGRNLLHMAAQNGCFFLVHCLIEKGFDPSLVNDQNGWNVFHYAASCVAEPNNRVLKLLDYLSRVVGGENLNALDAKGTSVIELAVHNKNFKEAQSLIEAKFAYMLRDERSEAVESTVRRMLGKLPSKLVIEFLTWCVAHTNNMDWTAAYDTCKAKTKKIDWVLTCKNQLDQ